MILPSTYKDFWKYIVANVSELNDYLVVSTEEGLGKKIKDLDQSKFPLLVAVLPSADPKSPNVDNEVEINQAIIFVLVKKAQSDRTDDNFISDMDATMQAMSAVKDLMVENKSNCNNQYHNIMERLDVGSFHQDPEYNYLGCDGYSLSFQFNTVGF